VTVRRLGAILGALVVLAAVAGATAPAPAAPAPAEAATASPVYRTDGVEGRMNTYASQVSEAQIWDLQVIGTTIYVAGKFTKVVQASGSWPRVDQRFLAAFDTETGEWVDTWRPRLNRPAYALDVLPSGSLVVGGEFTIVNGHPARAIVALDPVTGATDTRFRAGVLRKPDETNRFAVVRDFDVRGNRVYAVGHFNRAQGPTGSPIQVQKAVRFSTANGAPDATWIPRLAGNTAYAVAVSTDGKRVHLGGEFSSVNGRAGTSQLATVNARTGTLVKGWNHGSNATPWPTWPVGGVVFDLDVYKNYLYVAGAEHFWERRNSTTGASLRFEHISNDGQTVEVVGNRVYIGCHCYHRDPGHQLWEVNAQTGVPYPGRTLALQSGDGTWATAVAEDGCVWLGGDFNVAYNLAGQGTGEYWVGRLARLCPPGGPEAVPAPTPRPGPINPPGWTPPSPH
jgi:hypothetical protein